MGAAPFPSSIPDDRMDQVRTRYVQPDPTLEGFEEFYYADTGEVIPPDDAEDLLVSCQDVGREEFHRCTKAVGERLRKLTGFTRRKAERLAGEVCGCIRLVDDEGMLVFRDGRGRVAARLAYDLFADVLRWDEDEEEERLSGLEVDAAGEIVMDDGPSEAKAEAAYRSLLKAAPKE